MLRNLLHAVPLWALCRLERETSADDGAEPTSGLAGEAGDHAAAGTAATPPVRTQRTVPENGIYTEDEEGPQRSWYGWRERHAGGGGAGGSAGRRLWGDLEASTGSDRGHGNSRGDRRRRLEPMEVEFQSSDSVYSVEIRPGAETRLEARGRGQREGGAGLLRLIDAVLGTLEGAATGEACAETSSAVSAFFVFLFGVVAFFCNTVA